MAGGRDVAAQTSEFSQTSCRRYTASIPCVLPSLRRGQKRRVGRRAAAALQACCWGPTPARPAQRGAVSLAPVPRGTSVAGVLLGPPDELAALLHAGARRARHRRRWSRQARAHAGSRSRAPPLCSRGGPAGRQTRRTSRSALRSRARPRSGAWTPHCSGARASGASPWLRGSRWQGAARRFGRDSLAVEATLEVHSLEYYL